MRTQRGTGSVPGAEASAQRVEALEALERLVQGCSFPISRDELAACLGDASLPLGVEGQGVDAAAIVKSLPIDEFSSPQHLREAVDLNWLDFADVYHPGGGG
ncbi:MAG TPA: hypothetical protein VNZ52_01360 [Candidatus Thermoplasmatota archaeon]|nr:hypothetical protein [Candidatus Thermoplasmatota archaeon]